MPTVNTEMASALWRNNVVTQHFKMSLYEVLDPALEEKLSNPDHYTDAFNFKDYHKQYNEWKKYPISKQLMNVSEKGIKDEGKPLFTADPSKKDFGLKYRGELLLKEILLQACANQSNLNLLIIILILIRLQIPFISRYYTDGEFFGFDVSGAIFTFMESAVVSVFLFQNYVFIFLGFTEFQRKTHMITSCGALLKPCK